MKTIGILTFGLIILGCSLEESKVNRFTDNGQPTCPEGHTDSLIPVEYGMPSEELFADADSGKVWLGGCELPDVESNWYCKKHHIQF